jgi:uncharacterized membrane protein HdeD (DUF308 family)
MGSWLRRNWPLVLRGGVYLAVAVSIIAVWRNYDVTSGIVIGLFILNRGVMHTFVALVARAARGHLIDLRESTRRMSKIFGGEAIVFTGLVIVSLFSKLQWIALLPGFSLVVRVFLFFKLKKDYQKQPAGEYYQKGKYD